MKKFTAFLSLRPTPDFSVEESVLNDITTLVGTINNIKSKRNPTFALQQINIPITAEAM